MTTSDESPLLRFERIDPDDKGYGCCFCVQGHPHATVKLLVGEGEWMGWAACDDEQHMAIVIAEALAEVKNNDGTSGGADGRP